MNRRDTLKNILAGTAGAALISQATSCEQPLEDTAAVKPEPKGYGMRLPHELKHDARIAAEDFFTDAEKNDLTILTDIIAPGGDGEPSATDCAVVDFIEFMALDQPDNFQDALRGGLGWLNIEASSRFAGRDFAALTPEERIQIVDDIAWPEEAKGTRFEAGAAFFDRLRFLTLTGYFTSKEGIKTLDYQGNAPNVWDGVPQEVLDKHGLEYDPEYLPLYVDQSKRDVQAEWDEEMNLIS
ncbi:MAG: gluconate 2-dehydrogenase subunit 3 family protein [Bacteroidota bacterium]